MYIEKKNFYFGVVVASIFMISGCIPSHNRCFKGMEKLGYYCYKNYNYGRNLTSSYKKGIRDGCRTAEGHFVRDYSLSSVSEDYKSGWDAGRSTCRLIVPEEARSDDNTQHRQDPN